MASKKAAKAATAVVETAPESGTREITERSVVDLRPDPLQPRQHFDVDAIVETLSGPNPRIREPLRIRATRPGEKDRDGKPAKAPWTIIDGETRWRAATQKGMATVPCQPPEDLSDADLLVEQLASSVTKKSLRPLEEADAVARLANGKKNLSADEIAHRTGLKSAKAVYKAIALSKLCPEAREALEQNTILHGVALLVATITDPEAQASATKELVLSKRGENVRDAKWLIDGNYHLALVPETCGFNPSDATLPGGACGKCPKSTEAQRSLGIIDDEHKDARCTDRKCFAGKRDATWQRRKAEAIKNGMRVIEGEDALKLFPSPHSAQPRDVTIAWLGEQGFDGTQYKKFRDIVPDLKPTMLVAAHGKVYECVPRIALVEALRAAGAGVLAENEAEWLKDDDDDENETREASNASLPKQRDKFVADDKKAREKRERAMIAMLNKIDPSVGLRFWRFLAGLAVRMQQNAGDLDAMRTRRSLPVLSQAEYTYQKDCEGMLDWLLAAERTVEDCAQIVVEVLVGEHDEFLDLALQYAGVNANDSDDVSSSKPASQCDICEITEDEADGFALSWANDEETRCTRCAGNLDAIIDFIEGNECTDAELQEAMELSDDEMQALVSHLVTAKRIESKKKRWVLTKTEKQARKEAER